jgi:hypothetical protein
VYGIADAELAISPVAVQTSACTATAGNLIPASISGGGFTITLPDAPADQTRVAVKIIATNAAATNVLTVTCQGTDRFNESGGSVTMSLSMLNQGQIYQYSLTYGIWYITDDSLPLSGLKALFKYIFPSGDSTGAKDTAAINAGLASGGSVQLMPAPLSAPYYINAPITPTSQSCLRGAQWWSGSTNDNYSAGSGTSGGTTIVMVAGFTGSAAILMQNTTGTQYYGVDISGITIEGYELSSGTIYGLLVDGAWGACFLRGVCIHRPPADCARFVTDTTSGKIPDDWVISQCKFSASRAGYGVYAAELADSWFTDCESSENDLDGWYINYGVQSRWINCKGENNGGSGFHLTGLGSYQTQYFTGCSTHINQHHGFYFDNSGPAGGGSGALYVLTGCVAQQDGQASTSGGYAGFAASACTAQVIGTGCVAQEDSTTDYPQYGASQVSSSAGMCFTGSWLKTAAGVTHDDASNTTVLANQFPAGGAGAIVPLSQGGTGQASAAAAFNALSPMTTTGDMMYDSSGGTAARLPAGSPGQYLGISGGVPAWTSAPGAGGTLTGYLAPAVSALTYGTSVAVNAALGNVFTLTLTASTATIAAPSNPVAGQVIEFDLTQGTGGSFTVAWASGSGGFDFGAAGAPTLSTTAADVDAVSFRYSSAKGKWLCLGYALGF